MNISCDVTKAIATVSKLLLKSVNTFGPKITWQLQNSKTLWKIVNDIHVLLLLLPNNRSTLTC